MRALFMALGIFFTGLGFVGAFLPVIPTVPFLIVAAACFTRSSTRLDNWLMNHRQFGPLLRDWRTRGAIPLRAKWMSLVGSSIGYVLFVIGSSPGWPLAIGVAALITCGITYVFTRPSA